MLEHGRRVDEQERFDTLARCMGRGNGEPGEGVSIMCRSCGMARVAFSPLDHCIGFRDERPHVVPLLMARPSPASKRRLDGSRSSKPPFVVAGTSRLAGGTSLPGHLAVDIPGRSSPRFAGRDGSSSSRIDGSRGLRHIGGVPCRRRVSLRDAEGRAAATSPTTGIVDAAFWSPDGRCLGAASDDGKDLHSRCCHVTTVRRESHTGKIRVLVQR